MRVDTLMTRQVETCRPEHTLEAAAQIMWEADCGCVPVTDGGAIGSGRRVIGIITDRDICMAAYLTGQPLHALRIDGVMARCVRACHPHDSIAAAEEIMRTDQVRRLPVIDEHGELVGILSLNDIVLSPRVCPDEVAETIGAISQPRCPSGPGELSEALS